MSRRRGRGCCAESAREARIRAIVDAFEKQGLPPDGDRRRSRVCGLVGCREVEQAGLTPARESFSIDRVDLVDTAVVARGRRIDGVPLFDAAFTDAGRGRGPSRRPDGRRCPDRADADSAERRWRRSTGRRAPCQPSPRHRVRHTRRPAGLCPSNADAFEQPFGPPVVQVSSEEAALPR